MELDCPSYTAGSNQYFGGSVQFQDGTKRLFFTQTRDAANTVGWAASGSAIAGAGNFAVTGFDRLFATIQWNPDADSSDLNHVWAANEGRGAGPAASSHCKYDDAGNVGSTKIHIQTDFASGVGGYLVIREFRVYVVT